MNNSFNTVMKHNKSKNHFTIIQEELQLYGHGDTIEAAIEMLIDLVIDNTDDYFECLDTNMVTPECASIYKYFSQLQGLTDYKEIEKLLNITIVR